MTSFRWRFFFCSSARFAGNLAPFLARWLLYFMIVPPRPKILDPPCAACTCIVITQFGYLCDYHVSIDSIIHASLCTNNGLTWNVCLYVTGSSDHWGWLSMEKKLLHEQRPQRISSQMMGSSRHGWLSKSSCYSCLKLYGDESIIFKSTYKKGI